MKLQADQSTSNKTSTDFSLLLDRLETQILSGENEKACLRNLARESIWKRLDEAAQLKWARLAQMAGDVETAIKVFGWINKTQPQVMEAWVEHVELLSLLGRKNDLASVLARAKGFLDEDQHRKLAEIPGNIRVTEDEDEFSDVSLPFEKLQKRQGEIALFLELFSGREDCFARQWSNKAEGRQGYVPVRRAMEPQDVEVHLGGRKTYGIYLLKSDGMTKLGVIDIDLAKNYRRGKLSADEKNIVKRERHYLFSRLKEMSAMVGLDPLVEFSGGKGFHFWFFFETPLEPRRVKNALEQMADPLNKDLTAFNIEVFPKQNHLSGKGLGNLVKLPLGIHRGTGRPSYFVACHHRTRDAQLDFLSNVRPVSPADLKYAEQEKQAKKISLHPRLEGWVKEYPELFKLEEYCPPLGQLIGACRNGAALRKKDEKVLFQTVGFLPRARTLVHYLLSFSEDYNPHLTDYTLSRIRGTPLGCKRIHSLLDFNGDLCTFKRKGDYFHPLLHFDKWEAEAAHKAEKVEDLSGAIDNLKVAMSQVERFLR